MTLDCLKLGRAVTFMKYFIFLAETLTWNKFTFPASNLLNFAELVENKTLKLITKKFVSIPSVYIISISVHFNQYINQFTLINFNQYVYYN